MVRNHIGMMFQVSAQGTLTNYPLWLDSFRATYDVPFPPHITLKNSTRLEYGDINDLEITIKNICKSYNPFRIIFGNDVFIGQSSKGLSIMVRAQQNKQICDLQHDIRTNLSQFGSHVDEFREKFEQNFEPHITIARRLSEKNLLKAKEELQDDIHAVFEITKVVLTIVEHDVFEEWNDEKNKVIYKL